MVANFRCIVVPADCRTQLRLCKSIDVFGITSSVVGLYNRWTVHHKEHKYRKVASSSMSRLVAHFQIFRRLMKVLFDAYVL